MTHNDSLSRSVAALDPIDNEEDEEQVLDVLDLPQLHQKPSVKSILDTLSLLAIEPRSWDASRSSTPVTSTPHSASGASTPSTRRRKVRSEGVPQYLTRIISSRLAWIPDDDEKEIIWDAASSRLSERSGRTGMGAITRSFRIPIAHDPETAFDIAIHEPALTEDNLGLKTWASSYVLARKWHTLKERLPRTEHGPDRTTILELGAGTGLVGIAAAAVLGASVLLTDLPDIVLNLQRNVDANIDTITGRVGHGDTAILDWTVPEKIIFTQNESQKTEQLQKRVDNGSRELIAEPESSRYPLVVSADPIYSKSHPQWLVQTVARHLSKTEDARVVVIIPIREAYAEERDDFRSRMKDAGLVIAFEDTDIGYDDWSERRGEELKEVECWTSVWQWKHVAQDG